MRTPLGKENKLSRKTSRVKVEPSSPGDFKSSSTVKKRSNDATREEGSLFKEPKKMKMEPESPTTYDETKTHSSKVKEEPQTKPLTKSELKKMKQEEEEKKVWKWWEEEKVDDGSKWTFLEHKGPLFAPDYERLPQSVRFYYDGEVMTLSDLTEEAATFYGKMLDHDYTTKEVFNKNYFKDWRKIMSDDERSRIRDFSKCDFTEINEFFKKTAEERKNRSKEEKKIEKEKNELIVQQFGVAIVDGHDEKIGNFRIEPPGLFRGRGEHPKQGMIKGRIHPEDVIINCSKDSKWPQPPKGHTWKEIRHDNSVTWLASWTENIQNSIKYVMLNPSSKLKGEKDMEKYEKARQLKGKIEKIREDYTADFKSKEMKVRQRAVALYFIDKLALRAGNEKDDDQADTVGCCSLRIEHIKLHKNYEGKENVVELDFLGKDSIRYHNFFQVEKSVFRNLGLFFESKSGSDELFDRLNTSMLNEYLSSLMPGLTAKVFRTYNASITLQEQLCQLTEPKGELPAKILSYNRANRAVALLCNHQRSVPKTFDSSMAKLQEKIDLKTGEMETLKGEVKEAKRNNDPIAEKKKLKLTKVMESLCRLETSKTDREENKQVALGTSKLNYLDPRITVAWCKKHDVAIEKIFTKTHRDKFRWAIDMADEHYIF